MSTERVKSGYYYPNKMGRIYLTALEEVMGKNGLNAILRLAKLEHYIDNYPPDNLNKEFAFEDIAALHQALEEMYGPRGGRGLCQRAGRALFANGLKNFGALAGAGDLAFKVLPLSTKMKIAVPAIAKVFNATTDQISNTHEFDDHYIYTLERCSMCWNRTADKPICHTAVGIIQEALKWMSGGREFRVEMVACKATGAPIGKLKIYKEPIAE
ncbi:MAG: 4-vinyl reductase [Anaerolineales bacterium]|nr:4-vinyl reductase [Anaerolineales bacterium]